MANKKISELLEITSLAGTEELPVVQSASTKKIKITSILNNLKRLENVSVSGSTSLSVNKTYICSMSASATFTLPNSSLVIGDYIEIIDVLGNFSINNLYINRNGINVNFVAEDLILNQNGLNVKLVYYGGTLGWRVSKIDTYDINYYSLNSGMWV